MLAETLSAGPGGTMTSASFERVAGFCAMAVAMTAFLYAIAFTAFSRIAPAGLVLSAAFLMLGGLLNTVVQVALYQRLRQADNSWALLAFVLGLVGALVVRVESG